MLKIRFIATLLIAIFINPYVICANDRDSILFATGSMNCVLRVYSDGNIEKVLYLDGPSGYGAGCLRPQPDGRQGPAGHLFGALHHQLPAGPGSGNPD